MKILFHRFGPQLGVTALLAVLLLTFIVTSPQTFLRPDIYMAFLATIPFTALLAMGVTFCVAAGEIDLSFPSLMAISGLTFAAVFKVTGNAGLGLLAALVTGVSAGLLNAVLVVSIGVPSIIATIGTQFFLRGATVVLANGLAFNLVEVRETWTHDLLAGRLFSIVPVQSLWCAGLAGLFWLILNRHVFGDALLFAGDNFKAARMMGIPVNRARYGLFMFMGAISALVSVMICLEMANWWPTQGEGYLLLVFASVFIGGTSVFGGKATIYGTLVGAAIIGIIEAGIIAAGLAGFWTRLVYGLIIIISVSLHSWMLKTSRE